MISSDQIDLFSDWLMYAMQASILIPMAVVWRQRQHFSPAVRLLSWYVYLSLTSVLLLQLYPRYLPSNYAILVAFNMGRIALFGAVYHHVLRGRARQVVAAATAAALVAALAAVAYNLSAAVTIIRVVQCAVLAGFALLYLEQRLERPAARPNARPAARDPLWLLSVGQLLYSAGTVTAFSFTTHVGATRHDVTVKFLFVSISGLVFNYFLTLAFLRAQASQAVEPGAEPVAERGRQLAKL